MSRTGYNATPPPHLLPPPEEQAWLAAHLNLAPGLDLREATATSTLPVGGLHVSSHIRPGFNGNVLVKPYRTGSYEVSPKKWERGKLTIRGYGHFCMLYENPTHMLNAPPCDRMPPDFMPIGLGKDTTEQVTLQNKGRLLVQKAVADTRGSDEMLFVPETSYWTGVVCVERVVRKNEIRALMMHIATGMGLQGPDISVFAAQPARKIVPMMPVLSRISHRLSR